MKFTPSESLYADAEARAYASKQLAQVVSKYPDLAEWEQRETFDHYYNEFLRIAERADEPVAEEAKAALQSVGFTQAEGAVVAVAAVAVSRYKGVKLR